MWSVVLAALAEKVHDVDCVCKKEPSHRLSCCCSAKNKNSSFRRGCTAEEEKVHVLKVNSFCVFARGFVEAAESHESTWKGQRREQKEWNGEEVHLKVGREEDI